MSWNEVKYAVNSTLGTDKFTSLDQVLINSFGGHQMFTENGTFTVPAGITEIYISACAAGGSGGNGTSSHRTPGVAGKAGEFILRQRVSVDPGSNINIVTGEGNTIITLPDNEITLIANSTVGCAPNDVLGYMTGFSGIDGYVVYVDSTTKLDRVSELSSSNMGKPGNGGAFGFGGAGGNYISSGDAAYPSLGGAHFNLEQSKFRGRGGYRTASLVNGGDSAYPSSSYRDTDGAAAGGYGAGGGGGASGDTGRIGGQGSPGMVFIEWGGLRR